jgi:ABC-type multidrug transport system fused ATPase/permease subunit
MNIIAGLILVILLLVILFFPWILGRIINFILKIDSTMHPINEWLVGMIITLTIFSIIIFVYSVYNIILIQLTQH